MLISTFLSKNSMLFRQEHNTCKLEILSSFQKINIGTQKSSIHSIFPAGSTSLHACLYQHFSLKTACYLNKNTTHANWTKCHFHGPKQGNNQRGKIPYLLKCVGSVLDPPKSGTMEEKSFLLPFSFLSFFLFSFLPFFLFFLSFSLFFLLLLSTNCLPSHLKFQVVLTKGSPPNIHLFDTWSTQDQVSSMPQLQPLSCSCMRVA